MIGLLYAKLFQCGVKVGVMWWADTHIHETPLNALGLDAELSWLDNVVCNLANTGSVFHGPIVSIPETREEMQRKCRFLKIVVLQNN